VLSVLTHENAPAMKPTPVFGEESEQPGAASSSIPYLNTDEIYFYGQPIAVIVAETLEQAEHATTLVTVDYEEQEAKLSLTTEKSNAVVPANVLGESADLKLGDAEGALAAARYKVDNVYSTPPYNHNAIELHATLAYWSEDETSLTVYDATQYVIGIQEMLATKFSLAKDHVRVIGSFVGGGFGGKGNAWAHVSLAVAGAEGGKGPGKVLVFRGGVALAGGGGAPPRQRVALPAHEVGERAART